jgi:hypothetical protein
MAERSPPIVVGMRQTSNAIRTVADCSSSRRASLPAPSARPATLRGPASRCETSAPPPCWCGSSAYQVGPPSTRIGSSSVAPRRADENARHDRLMMHVQTTASLDDRLPHRLLPSEGDGDAAGTHAPRSRGRQRMALLCSAGRTAIRGCEPPQICQPQHDRLSLRLRQIGPRRQTIFMRRWR